MDTDELIGKMRSGKWTRREMNKALASVGLAMVSIPLVRKTSIAAAEDHPLVFTTSGLKPARILAKASSSSPKNEKFGGSPYLAS